jgi:hypothetical protein
MLLAQVWIGLLLQMQRAYNKSQLSKIKIEIKIISSEKNDSKFNISKHLKSKNYEIASKKTSHIIKNKSKAFQQYPSRFP